MTDPNSAYAEIVAQNAAAMSLLSDLFMLFGAENPAELDRMREAARQRLIEVQAAPPHPEFDQVTFWDTKHSVIDDACNRLGHPAPSTAEVISLSDRSLN